MGIQVKGVNDHLSFIFDEETDLRKLLEDLETILDGSLFNRNSNYFPKAYFDFKSRKLSKYEFKNFYQLIMRKEVVLFSGMNVTDTYNPTIEVVDGIIHNGEMVEKTGDVLFIGKINPGGYLKSSGNLYLLGHVEGNVIATHPSSIISAQSLKNASIEIYSTRIHDLTVFSLSMFYYKNGEIFSENGVNNDGKEYSSNIR